MDTDCIGMALWVVDGLRDTPTNGLAKIEIVDVIDWCNLLFRDCGCFCALGAR